MPRNIWTIASPPRLTLGLGAMRDKVLGYGWPFKPQWSSNSRRKPRLFDWTADPAQATTDVTVYIGGAVRDGIGAPGRKIAWLHESPQISRWLGNTTFVEENLERVVANYEAILTPDRGLCARHPRILYHPGAANLPWIPEEQYGIYNKTKLCSMFASKKSMVPAHEYRKQVAAKLMNKLDLFGGACGSRRIGGDAIHPDKSEGMLPYMFQVVMENAKVDFYYTEKITDCFATGTVPIYWGSDCIGELFDTDWILTFDEDFDIDSLRAVLYYETMPAIRNNFRLVQQLEGTDDILYRRYIRPSENPHGVTPWKQGSPAELQSASQSPTAVPWQAWDSERILAVSGSTDASHQERLRVVTSIDKTHIQRVDEVPKDFVSVRTVEQALRPRCALAGGESAPAPELSTAFLLHLPDAFIGDSVVFDRERYYGMGRWWLGDTWRRYAKVREVRHIPAGVSIGAWGGEAFQHFVIDALPALASVIDLLEKPEMRHVRIVSHNEPQRAAQWFWKRLGLSDRIVSKPRNVRSGFVIHADLVLFPQFEPNLNQLGLYPRDTLRPIQRRLGSLDPGERDLVVYLRRVHKRSVANEDELFDALGPALADSGLTLHTLEGLPPQEAEPLIKRARIILGPHGGAFANLAFARPGTHVIEFVPAERIDNGKPQERLSMYYGLAQAAGLEYWNVDPENFAHLGSGMRVNADEVAAIVRTILQGQT